MSAPRSTKADREAEQKRIGDYAGTVQNALLDLLTSPDMDGFRDSQGHYHFFTGFTEDLVRKAIARFDDRPELQRAALAGMLAHLVGILARDYAG
jgi:hypothetical protein